MRITFGVGAAFLVAAGCGGKADIGGTAAVSGSSTASSGSIASGSSTASSGSIASGSSTASGSSDTSGATSSGTAFMSGSISPSTGSIAATGGPSSGGSSTGAMPSSGSASGSSGVATAGSDSAGPSGAPSGVTVVINGVAVPKEKAIAFIHFGHSNMAGRGGMPPASRPYFFTDVDPQAVMYKQGAFHPALEPFTAGDTMNNSPYYIGEIAPLGGPGTPLVKEAHAMAPSYYFISLGHGTASGFCSQYLPGNLYYDAMMREPKALLGKVTFGGIFVMLGITERHGTAQDVNGYAQCINTLITQIRTDLGVPNLPLLLTDYEMMAQDLPPTAPFGQQIIPQIHMVPNVVFNSALVPTDNLVMCQQPDHHFDLEGHRVWSQRALDIMKAKGWFPWSG